MLFGVIQQYSLINGSTDPVLRLFLDPDPLFLWRVRIRVVIPLLLERYYRILTHELTSALYYRILERYYHPGHGSKKLLLLQARYYCATLPQYYHG